LGIFGWILVGLIAGALAQLVIPSRRRGCVGTLVVGVLGGLIGGALSSAAGGGGVDDFGLTSILIAFLGASLLLLVLEAITRR
jgi:uncharacterized membrane protein YeaQ/YmgE (transglycosylase-associated protein family)